MILLDGCVLHCKKGGLIMEFSATSKENTIMEFPATSKETAVEIINKVPALKKILALSIGHNANLMVCGWGETDAWEHREDSHSYYVEHYSDYSD